MGYIQKDGFDFVEDLKGNPEFFLLKGINLDKELSYITQNRITALYLTYFESAAIVDLDFLADIPFIEKININDLDVDYSGIYFLTDLKVAILSVKNKKQHLDYTKFKKIELLSIDWYKDFPDLSEMKKLRELYIWKFKPKSNSFSELLLPKYLDLLHVTDTNIESMIGLQNLHIRQLEVYFGSKLVSLKGLEDLSEYLDTLVLDNCKKIKYFEPLSKCVKMKKMILTKCGEIQTLRWLQEMKNLKMFTFSGTNIIDGNLSFCFGIDYVYFKNAKHYNHRVEEFS